MMDLAAIFHQARVPMCCALDQDTLQITLRTGLEVDSVQLIYADPYEAGIAGGEESWEGRRMAMQGVAEHLAVYLRRQQGRADTAGGRAGSHPSQDGERVSA